MIRYHSSRFSFRFPQCDELAAAAERHRFLKQSLPAAIGRHTVSPSRMGIRIIRTLSRAPASPDTYAIQPWLDITACPHAPPGMLGFTLDRIKFSLGVLRPVKGKTVADQPFPEVRAVDRTCRHGSPVLIQRDRNAAYRSPGDKCAEIVRRLRSAPILQAVLAATKLTAFAPTAGCAFRGFRACRRR